MRYLVLEKEVRSLHHRRWFGIHDVSITSQHNLK